jgi:CubicO group peptidase (beta-lactamase class C family)
MPNDQFPPARRLSRRSVLALLGAAPVAVSGAAVALTVSAEASSDPADPPSGPPPPGLRPGGAYEQFVAGLAARDMFSGTVLLAWQGRPVLVRSYQFANRQLDIANQADTSFFLASLTKFFTGLAVTQLAAQGKVALHETLGRYLEGFPAAMADTVTVHQLLTHTSGIPDFSMSPVWQQEFRSWRTNEAAFDGTLSVIRQSTLAFTPGSNYAYSNSGYILAGAIVARASGQDFWEYVPQHIFAPAGMTRTGFFSGQQWLTDPGIAHNYGPRQADGQHQDLTPLIAQGPNGWNAAGGAFSSAPDLLSFARALQQGKLLSPAWTEVTTSGKHPISPAQQNPDEAPSQGTWTGYGTEERIVGGQRAFGHTGALELFVSPGSQPGGGSTSLSIYPDLDVVAVVLSNYFLFPGIGTFLAQQDRIITEHGS